MWFCHILAIFLFPPALFVTIPLHIISNKITKVKL